ncbi:unnamed protein product [Leptosia nina]|uniref:Exonuclease domain-containing protein n=1 Tax=Leptosia nina TaxID=320188 RepID=A0AAV1K2T0_9NEOP
MNILMKKTCTNLKNLVGTVFIRNAKRTPKMQTANTHLKNEANRIVWCDLEMTGLDIEKDQILEIACLVSDAELNVVAMGPDIVIRQPDHVLNAMGEWCSNHHEWPY